MADADSFISKLTSLRKLKRNCYNINPNHGNNDHRSRYNSDDRHDSSSSVNSTGILSNAIATIGTDEDNNNNDNNCNNNLNNDGDPSCPTADGKLMNGASGGDCVVSGDGNVAANECVVVAVDGNDVPTNHHQHSSHRRQHTLKQKFPNLHQDGDDDDDDDDCGEKDDDDDDSGDDFGDDEDDDADDSYVNIIDPQEVYRRVLKNIVTRNSNVETMRREEEKARNRLRREKRRTKMNIFDTNCSHYKGDRSYHHHYYSLNDSNVYSHENYNQQRQQQCKNKITHHNNSTEQRDRYYNNNPKNSRHIVSNKTNMRHLTCRKNCFDRSSHRSHTNNDNIINNNNVIINNNNVIINNNNSVINNNNNKKRKTNRSTNADVDVDDDDLKLEGGMPLGDAGSAGEEDEDEKKYFRDLFLFIKSYMLYSLLVLVIIPLLVTVVTACALIYECYKKDSVTIINSRSCFACGKGKTRMCPNKYPYTTEVELEVEVCASKEDYCVVAITHNLTTFRGCIKEAEINFPDCRYNVKRDGMIDWYCACEEDFCNKDFISCGCRTYGESAGARLNFFIGSGDDGGWNCLEVVAATLWSWCWCRWLVWWSRFT